MKKYDYFIWSLKQRTILMVEDLYSLRTTKKKYNQVSEIVEENGRKLQEK